MEHLNISKIEKVYQFLLIIIIDFDINKLKESTTLYIGNLSYFITETQIYELFSRIGLVQRIIMGLNKQTKTPCGFCFVE